MGAEGGRGRKTARVYGHWHGYIWAWPSTGCLRSQPKPFGMAIPVCRPCRGAGSGSHDAIRHGRSARVQTNPQASPPTKPSRANKRVPRTIAPYSRGNLANSLGYARDVNIALHFGPLYHAGSLRVARRPPSLNTLTFLSTFCTDDWPRILSFANKHG